MASDYLLEIEGIKGESNVKGHEGAIDVESFSWGASNAGTAGAGGGGGAGKVSFQDLHFTSRTSTASPSLFLACASGMHIKKAVLTVRKAGAEQQDFYVIALSDILVSGYTSGGAAAAETVPTDQFSINFAAIKFQIKELDDTGRLSEGVTVGWDLKKNTKI